MRRHGNAGEALLHQVGEGARAVGEGIETTFNKVRDGAGEVGGRAVGFAKEHPIVTAASIAAGISLGLLIVYSLRR